MKDPKTKQCATVTERKNGMEARRGKEKGALDAQQETDGDGVIDPTKVESYVCFMLKNTIANDTASMKSHAIKVRLSNHERTYMRAQPLWLAILASNRALQRRALKL